MENKRFKALVVTETDDKRFTRGVTTRSIDDLPEGDVLINVRYSSLNYKDALSASGNKGVTRKYPHTPGIDAAGQVVESTDERCKPGDRVIVTSFDLGMNTSGGFAEYIRVPADWVVGLPKGLTEREAMIYGTAGYTAGLSIDALIETVRPEHGDILVTGATGGVGCMAVALLKKLGYRVVAVSGKPSAKEFLKKLGAEEVISRQEATDDSGRPVLKAKWAGVIDTVGGEILATALKSTNYNGTVTCCGMVASPDLPINVFPFILRNVRLLGIDSQNTPMEKRAKIWGLLGNQWKIEMLDEIAYEIGLGDLEDKITAILQGRITGRGVVNLARQ